MSVVDFGPCFVCFEDNAPRAKCACTDMYVHPTCHATLLSHQGDNVCRVCLEPYRPVLVATPDGDDNSCVCAVLSSILTSILGVACAVLGVVHSPFLIAIGLLLQIASGAVLLAMERHLPCPPHRPRRESVALTLLV